MVGDARSPTSHDVIQMSRKLTLTSICLCGWLGAIRLSLERSSCCLNFTCSRFGLHTAVDPSRQAVCDRVAVCYNCADAEKVHGRNGRAGRGVLWRHPEGV